MQVEPIVWNMIQQFGSAEFVIGVVDIVDPGEEVGSVLWYDLILHKFVFPGVWQEFLLQRNKELRETKVKEAGFLGIDPRLDRCGFEVINDFAYMVVISYILH